MPEFQLDTAGTVVATLSAATPNPTDYPNGLAWRDLDAFTQGYIEALFFTEQGDGYPGEDDGTAQGLWLEVEPGLWSNELGFSDLAPETLARIIADCAAFQESRAWADTLETYHDADEAQAGHDFWYTRSGHGCGFWDGDWPTAAGLMLTDLCDKFGGVDAYLGDDGKVYLS